MREIILIDAVSPFRLDLTVWTLRRRPDNRIDQWDGSTYQRVFLMEDTPVEVSVSQVGQDWDPKIQVAIKYNQPVTDLHDKIREKLDRMLGLKVDLTEFYSMADSDSHLRPLVRYFRGLKPPRYPSIFEALVNAIGCQQITLTLGIQLLSRMAQNFGRPFDPDLENEFAFPIPEDLAALETETLQQLGFSRQKSTAIIQLAAALAARPNELEGLSALDNDQVISKLTGLRGIGRWSAEYALLRGLGRLDVFPTGDVGARKSLGKWLGSTDELDDAAVKQTLDLWQPYSGLIYFHLLLKGLSEKGVLPMPEERNAL